MKKPDTFERGVLAAAVVCLVLWLGSCAVLIHRLGQITP